MITIAIGNCNEGVIPSESQTMGMLPKFRDPLQPSHLLSGAAFIPPSSSNNLIFLDLGLCSTFDKRTDRHHSGSTQTGYQVLC